jgi:hypothetical protein
MACAVWIDDETSQSVRAVRSSHTSKHSGARHP